jgi:hypothetical protein
MVYHGNKKKGRNPGSYPYTLEDMKRVQWCMNKGINIAVIPNGTNWSIELNINKKIHLDPKEYTGEEALGKMYEYYKYYYDRGKR